MDGILRATFHPTGPRDMYQQGCLSLSRGIPISTDHPSSTLYILRATGGGLRAGDRLSHELYARNHAHICVGTQAATQIHRMDPGADYAYSSTLLHATKGSCIEYMPHALIPFEHARYTQDMIIHAESGASIIQGDIVTAGRIARQEKHAYEQLSLSTRVYVDNHPVYIDTTSHNNYLHSPIGAHSWNVWANILVICPDKTDTPRTIVDTWRSLFSSPEYSYVGCSYTDYTAWARILSPRIDIATYMQSQLWSTARTILVGQPLSPTVLHLHGVDPRLL